VVEVKGLVGSPVVIFGSSSVVECSGVVVGRSVVVATSIVDEEVTLYTSVVVSTSVVDEEVTLYASVVAATSVVDGEVSSVVVGIPGAELNDVYEIESKRKTLSSAPFAKSNVKYIWQKYA
jgi:hypothetical protein